MSTRGACWGWALLVAVIGASLMSTTASAQGQCVISYAWTASESENVLRRVDLTTMMVDQTISIDIPGQTVSGITGVAIEESTGDFLVLAYFASNPTIPFLIRYDVLNQFSSVIGSTFVDFVCLDFIANGELYAVSADTATPTNSFCRLSLLTGAPTDICLYGGGDDGEAIAYHPIEDRMYHASGALSVVFEAASAGAPVPCSADNITPDMALVGTAVSGLAYIPGSDAFLWTQDGASSSDFYEVTSGGVATFIGTANHSVSDVAIFEVPTPCPPGTQFVRGDANNDGGVNIADAIFLLGQLFISGSPTTTCDDSTDFNDDASVNIADAIFLLSALFTPTGTPPPAPNPDCGDDPTMDSLDCAAYNCP